MKFPDPEGEAKKLAAWLTQKAVIDGEGQEGQEGGGRQVKALPSGGAEINKAQNKAAGGTA